MKHHVNFQFLNILLVFCMLLSAVACAAPQDALDTDGAAGPIAPAAPMAPVESTGPGAPSEEATVVTDAPAVAYAPDFAVMDKDGNLVKLSDFLGKPIVLNFWATWCPPCKAELPDFDEAATAYGEDVVFLMVNLTDGSRDTVTSVKEFVSTNGYTFPVYFDTQYSAASAYQVFSIPTTYLINTEGVIVGSKVGMMSAAELEGWIQILLS